MASKFTLEVEYNYDFSLIGICSHEKDYRLCWALNKHLGIELVKTDDLDLSEKKTALPSKFPMFIFNDDEKYREYSILGNKSANKLLLPEHKQVDYLLMIKAGLDEKEEEELVKKIKELSIVLTAYSIEPENLKSKQNLLF